MSLQALGLTASQTGKGTFVISDRVRAPLLIGRYSPAHIKEVRRALEIPVGALCGATPNRSGRRPVRRAAGAHGGRRRSRPAQQARREISHRDRGARPAIALIVKLIEECAPCSRSIRWRWPKAPHRRKAAQVEHAQDLRGDRAPRSGGCRPRRWPSTSMPPSKASRCSVSAIAATPSRRYQPNRGDEDTTMKKIRTVTGDVPAEKMGRTLTHEHLLYTYPGGEYDHKSSLRSRQRRRSDRDRAQGRHGRVSLRHHRRHDARRSRPPSRADEARRAEDRRQRHRGLRLLSGAHGHSVLVPPSDRRGACRLLHPRPDRRHGVRRRQDRHQGRRHQDRHRPGKRQADAEPDRAERPAHPQSTRTG